MPVLASSGALLRPLGSTASRLSPLHTWAGRFLLICTPTIRWACRNLSSLLGCSDEPRRWSCLVPGVKAMVDHIEAAWQQDIDIRIHGLEHGDEAGYNVTVHEIEPGVIYSDSGLKITAVAVHYGSWPHAFGYRIDAPDRSIVISGDCSPSPALLEAAKGCDLPLYEVYSETEPRRGHFNRPDWPEYLRQFHTSTAQLAEIANQAKPKLLVMYHQIWGNVEDEALLKEVRRTYQGNVRSAKDLDVD
jgi:ribonuclease BN (tRNA processing enzyme)